MSRSLGVLTLDLVTKTSGFVSGLSKAERASAKSRKQFEKDLGDLTRKAKFASAAFAAGAVAMIGTSIKLADQSRKTAQSIGLSTEALTGFQFAAKQSGVSNEDLTTSFRRFSQSINDASNGIGKGKEIFEALDISIQNTDGTLKTSEALFYEVSNALASMDDGLQKTAFASELLGRSGSKLIPLLNGGEDGIRKLTDQAQRLGLVISDETGRNAEIFNDSLSVLNSTFRGTANTVVANFIPVMAEMANSLAESNIEGQNAIRWGDTLTEVLKATTKTSLGVAYAFETVGQRIARTSAFIALLPEGLDVANQAWAEGTKEIERTTKAYDEYLKRVDKIGTDTLAPTEDTTAGGGFVAPFSEQDGNGGTDTTKTDFEVLEDSFKTELELLQEKHKAENDLLAEARNQELSTIAEFDELELMLAERQAQQLTAIDEQRRRDRVGIFTDMFSNLSTLMNTESRKAFEVGKAAAYANAVVNGYEAAVASYEKGASIGGPPLGAAFAATSLAATGAQISAINSTKFGGGGGGAGGGASNTQAVNNASQGVTPPQAQTADRNVFIRGIEKGSLYSGEQLLDLINNELSNGGKVIANG